MTRKIDAVVGPESSPFEYGSTFARQSVGDRERLIIGLDAAQDACVEELAAALTGPFQLLYLLHTSRTDAELGRYESPELTKPQVRDFMKRFGPFLAQDARHDIWLRSHDDDATIVLDRHNLIYAYGPLDVFETILLRIGARANGVPTVPDPHTHYYHRDWDGFERDIFKAFDWVRTALRESDVQFRDGGDAG